MNLIINTAQMTIAFILMSGASQAAPSGSSAANKTPHINTAICKLATRQGTCHIFKLEPSVELPSNPDTFHKKIALYPKHPEKSKNFTFNAPPSQNGVSFANGTLKNIRLMPVSLGVSRIAHDESLDIVDSEASNEHAQVNVVIPLEKTIPAIEKYVQFFASSAYFTIAK